MRFKSSNAIFMLVICIVLATSIVGIEFFNKKYNKETNNYIDENIILNLVKNKTSIEIIKEATVKVRKGPFISSEKIAYITIDDGPSKYTNEILDILEANNVKATFFMIDGNMKKHPNEVERIEEEGHGAGFHSVSHKIDKLYKSPQITLQEFETCKETFYNITGETSKLIRVPYGSKPYMPEDSHEILLQSGYRMWDWNLDTQDWKGTTDNIVSNILYYGRNNPNLVILMHEKQQTVDALDRVIRILKVRGYDILPVTEDIQERNYWDKNL